MILRGLHTSDGRVIERKLGSGESRIDLPEALIVPGLVNAHDHLEFNLFPQMGSGPYADYTEWGPHIHRQYANEIASVRSIPARLRVQWGWYKNLLCGITTVVHHGDKRNTIGAPIRVWQEAQSLHSVRFDPLWALRLNNPKHCREDCMIHIGEGMNDASAEEVRRLLRFNLFRRPLIGIHGLALTPGQSERFKALVWCPSSNHFLFGATARVEQMRTTLLFGTDSTLTATWDLWEQLREARATQRLSDEALFNTLTGNARRILQLPEEPVTSSSDFVLLRKKHTRFFDAFYAAGPEDVLLVVVGGRIRLIDGELLPLLEPEENHFSSVSVHDSVKWVEGDLPALMAAIRRFRPEQAFPVRGLRSSPAPAVIAG